MNGARVWYRDSRTGVAVGGRRTVKMAKSPLSPDATLLFPTYPGTTLPTSRTVSPIWEYLVGLSSHIESYVSD